MFFASPFVSAALMMLSSVTALPQPEDGGLMGRATTSAPCPAGSYRYNSTACAFCPAGNTCDGTSNPKPCGTGYYQPNMNSNSCVQTPPGYFTSTKGSAAATPCPPGSYQPYCQQAFCYGAPKGRFQQQYGKAFVCGTCCGWAAPLNNNNVNPVNCTAPTPNAWPSSGDGCISAQTSCVRAQTCAQLADGTCPAETIRG